MKLPAAFLALALSTVFPAAQAQEADVPASRAGRTFTAADFSRFAPRTALDMLKQVPGLVIRAADQERGLGEASGNVLLNGQRLSGKSNDVLAELGRIPAANVLRIELVDGTAFGIPGLSGQVANVVARVGAVSGQWAWRPEFRSYYTDPLLTRGEVSVSGARGVLEYTLGVQNDSSHSGAGGPTDIYLADGSFHEHREDVWTSEYDTPTLSGRFVLDGPGDAVGNLNLSYQRVYYDFVEAGERSGPGLVDRVRDVEVTERGYNYEVGGDYAFAFGGGRLKLIGLERFIDTPTTQSVVLRFLDDTPPLGSHYASHSERSERIGRAEYRWTQGGADWQVSGEAVSNSLDYSSTLSELSPDGSYQPLPLPGGSATVEEDRYELMASYGRPLWTDATLQLSAGAEYSNLRQLGAGGLSRYFTRPKGRASLAWRAGADTAMNVSLERSVGQLDFYHFVAQVNLTDERENAGNPDLVPQQSWELQAEAVHDLGTWGSTSLRAYAHHIDDIVDIVPIGTHGESPGNLESARVFGAEWKGTLNFDPLGLRGAKLDARVQLQDSRVDDPLTGEPRPISNNLRRLAELAFRHDVAETAWAYGSSLGYEYYSRSYRLTEVGRQWEGPVWASVFVEHKNVHGLTVRATAGNLFGGMSMWDRFVYTGRRTGPLDFHEVRDRRIGPVFSFAVSGRF